MLSAVRRTVAALTLSTAMIGTTAALAAPAHAEKWTHDDAAGDVVRVTMGSVEPEQVPAPERTNVDVTRVVARHEGRTLTIKVRTRGRMGGMVATNSIIRTPHKRFWLSTMRMPGFMNVVSLDDVNRRKTPKCRGLERSFDASRTVMTLRVPRSCLGNPKWVRFSISLVSTDPLADDDNMYLEDGLREGTLLFGNDKMSPKIRRN